MARYLVTGGAGFIGSHLVEALISRGDDVVVLDNLSTGKRANLKPAENGPGQLTFVEGDITDQSTCLACMRGVDYVLHQAARPSVQRSVDTPLVTHTVNATGSLNVLIAARDAHVKRVVLASSSSVYGDVAGDGQTPKVETMVPRPQSPYAASKVAMEHYAAACCKVYGLETVCLRYFNIFGPRQDPESAYAAVIPRFLYALRDGGRPIICGDGRQSRDFTYVSNVVAANLAACEAPGVAGEVFNIASGRNYTLLELLDLLAGYLRVTPNPEYVPGRNGDVRHSLAALQKAQEALDYRVRVDFAQGIKNLVELAQQGKYLA
ncbi:MAG: NAD-dependent epimerase/dehydratase family protein [Deltaproteobacteria bacterium]|nr:NAD-dependent epimerase/dehydratase family protein [Deltaproteobacteria bacterium]